MRTLGITVSTAYVLAFTNVTASAGGNMYLISMDDQMMQVLNRTTLSDQDGYRTGWVTTMYARPIYSDKKVGSVEIARVLDEADCNNNRLRTIEHDIYSLDDALIGKDKVATHWLSARADTLGMGELDVLCERLSPAKVEARSIPDAPITVMLDTYRKWRLARTKKAGHK